MAKNSDQVHAPREPKDKYPQYIAEFIGTFILVLSIGFNVIPGVVNPAKASPFAVLSIASTLMVMVYSFGAVSGAHFNPAVTLAIKITQGAKFSTTDAVVYVLSQLTGGVCATLMFWAVMGENFNVAPKPGFHWHEAATVEFLYTFMLAFTVLNVAVSVNNASKEFFGLAIGFVIVAGGYATGWISGGCLNPAVAISLDLISATKGFGYSLLYAGFELLGGACAAFLYQVIRDRDNSSTFSMPQKLLCEFVGTFFLVLTVGLAVLGGAGISAGLCIASALMCMIYAVGDVSGAHLNPAVTLAIFLSGRDKISATDALQYVSTQLFAGFLASMCYVGLTQRAFPVAPKTAAYWGDAMCGEAFFTGVLCLAVLTSATTTKQPYSHFFGLIIGFCVVIGAYCIGGISGAHLNPAVSLGVDSANAVKGGKWLNCLFWMVAQGLGAAGASSVFRVTHTAEYSEKLSGMEAIRA